MVKKSDKIISNFLKARKKNSKNDAVALTKALVKAKIQESNKKDIVAFQNRRHAEKTETVQDSVEYVISKPKSEISDLDKHESYKPIAWWRDGFDYAIKNKKGEWTPTNDSKKATHILKPGKENVDANFQKDTKGRFISRPDQREVPILSCATIPINGAKMANMLKGSEGLPPFKFIKRIPRNLFGFKKESSIKVKQQLLVNIAKKCCDKSNKKEVVSFIKNETSHETLDRVFGQFAKAARNLGIIISRRPSEIAKKERFKQMAEEWRKQRQEKKAQEKLGVFSKISGVRL